MRARQRLDAAFDDRNISRDAASLGQSHDRLHDRHRVLGAVIDLAREQRLALLGFLALGNVHRDAADAHDFPVAVLGCGRRAGAPAHLAVGTPYAILSLVRYALLHQGLHAALQLLPVFWQDENLEVLGRDDVFARRDAIDGVLPLVPY